MIHQAFHLRSVFSCLMVSTLWFAVSVSSTVSSVRAENWPCWRGPRGDGTSQEKSVPTTWNGTTGEHVAWKTLIPGRGHSSPIVWNDQIFVTSCLEDKKERVLLSLDRLTGAIQWQQTVIESSLEKKHSLNSFASGTPATDGKVVYVTFLEIDPPTDLSAASEQDKAVQSQQPTPGEMVVAAYDMNGKQLWLVRPSCFSSVHGFCSSPVIFENLLIVNGDHDGQSHVLALDRDNGHVVWKVPRIHQTRSYCTPLIREAAGKTQMVLSGSKQVVSLDPRTGKQYWSVEGPTEQFVASMVFDGEKFYLTAGFPDYFVMAILPDGEGDVTDTHVQWSISDAKSYVPSPVLVNDRLLVADDRGTLNCFDTSDGSRLWINRLANHFSASLVAANGLVYCTADDGTVSVLKPDDELGGILSNPLGENSYASPAISQGQIFIRGEKHLYAIGQAK